MAQCPGCQKFPALTTNEDPECELEISGRTVKATIRLVRESECCSEEMKEANMEPEIDIDADKLAGHVDDEGEEMEGHDLSIEE